MWLSTGSLAKQWFGTPFLTLALFGSLHYSVYIQLRATGTGNDTTLHAHTTKSIIVKV